MADEEAKAKEKRGDQEAVAKMDWNSHGCKVFIQIMVVFAIAMLGVAIISRLLRFGDESSIFFYFWTIYLMLFIALLVISMLKVQKVLMYFTFLTTRKGVGMFLIFIGSLLFDWNHYFELSVSIILLGIGGLYVFYGLKVGEEQPPEPSKQGQEEAKQQDRRAQYEEGKGRADDRARQHVSPPSYQPRGGGEERFQRDGGVRNPGPVAAGAPPGYNQDQYPAEARDAPYYEPRRDDAPSYQPRDGGPPVRQEPQYESNAPVGPHYDEEEADNPGAYGGPPSYVQDSRPPPAQPQAAMRPPPPDEAPMELPESVKAIKKFKDINDLLK